MSAKQEAHTLTSKSKKSSQEAGSADKLLADVVESLEDHKAQDVIVINLRGKSDIADYMVIATGQSGRQVSTMADHLVLVVKKHGVVGAVPEGRGQADWVLLDGGDVIGIVEAPQLVDRRPRAVGKVLLIQPTENAAQFDDRADPGYRQRMIGGEGGTPKYVSADEDRRRQGATGSISSARRR